MILKVLKKILGVIVLSNLNVVAATMVCFVAFYKLPNNQPFHDFLSLAQLGLTCWAIYVLDRLKDNISKPEISTDRHKFHYDNQFILQILMIAAVSISVVIIFFQPLNLIIYGFFIIILAGFYLYFISPKFPYLKEIFMPFIYTLAVVGVPFVLDSSISLSSWILGLMFFGITIQNTFSFSFFEFLENESEENICKKIGIRNTRKVINYITALNIFVVIFFFSNQINYPNLLGFVLVTISLVTSLIVAAAPKFKNNYRWLIDSLLFLPLIIL
ncbi:hypothetical protein [Lacihabitans soyangensis]|uniref:Prenyltransferase n=1 Tax=Lacihabitans soyangensis TaxID=869394 RepID=A0AAE3H4S0_9BACT|nr:hypothetical protein [Lacihabitans soyangensis]MCP9765229.1 hypothetical protein [Lacihabitans soyangensis]